MSTIRVFNHYVKIPFIVLGIVESLGIFLSVILAHYLYFGILYDEFEFSDIYEVIWYKALAFTFFVVLAMIASGLYQAKLREGVVGFLLRLTAAFLMALVAVSALFYVFPGLFFGRGVMTITVILAFLFLATTRGIILLTDPSVFKKNILVLGAGKRASTLTELKRKSDHFGFNIIGFAHFRGEKDEVPGNRIINLKEPLVEFVLRNDVDEIVMAIDDRRKGIPMHELLDCKMHGIDVIDVVTFFERETGKIRIDQLHPSWLLFNDGFNVSTLRYFSKRGFDLLASGALLFLTWPIMALTAVAIWAESGFNFSLPILYRQVRIGEDGRPFQVLKFRSMVVDAEKSGQAQWAKKNDSRVTKVGKFIRLVRIDELPQIFNVFRGDMSFVGPRPERPQFVGMLSETLPYYAERHRVKPGITGWAQLLYPYGSSEKDALEKLQYDLYYVKNHSIFLDFLILLQTAEVVLFGKGAR